MVQQPSTPPLVVMSLGARLVAMNAHTGQRAWEHEVPLSTLGARLFVEQGLVIYAGGGGLVCLDYLSGTLRWQATLGSVDGRILLFAGCIICLIMGEAWCLNIQTGAQIWHEPFKGYGKISGAIAAPGVSAQVDHH